MKLTILGNNGPFPAADGVCSGYLLSSDSGKTNVLIDCGTGVLARLTDFIALETLDAVILSHLHFDHMSDMLPMQYALQFSDRAEALNVFLPDTPANVRALLETPAFALHPMKEVQIGEISFSFLPVRHPVESYALRACCDGKTFVYTGDTNVVDTLVCFTQTADLLLTDSGLLSADWNENSPHLSPVACAELARAANAKRLLLTHLNPRYTAAQHEREARAIRPDAQYTVPSERYLI